MHVSGGPCWWKDTCPHLLISGECRGRSSTKTRSWRWPRFWGRSAEEDAGCELQSHRLFKEKFGRPGKGNDKGKVEGLVGYARRNSLVPIPRVGSREELNTHLRGQCAKRRERRLRGQEETIGERFERDRTALLP